MAHAQQLYVEIQLRFQSLSEGYKIYAETELEKDGILTISLKKVPRSYTAEIVSEFSLELVEW